MRRQRQPKLVSRPPKEQRGERATRSLRERKTDRAQDLAPELETAIEVTGAQELLGGAALEIERAGGGRAGGGGEIGIRGLRAPSRIGERIGAQRLEHPAFVPARGTEL